MYNKETNNSLFVRLFPSNHVAKTFVNFRGIELRINSLKTVIFAIALTISSLGALSCTAQWQTQAQTSITSESDALSSNPDLSTDELTKILSQGTALENPVPGKKIDWNEALNYWELALRDAPTNRQLSCRYYRARINYDIDRRLADSQYIEQVRKMTQIEVHQILVEILLKIQTHFVDSPSFSNLSRNGLVGVQQAIRNPAFRELYFNQISNTELTKLTSIWLKEAIDFNVQNLQDIVTQAMLIGEHAQNECHINGSILVMEYICGLLNTLDPYTGLLTTSQLTDMYNQINGSFVGIGVELKVVKGEIRVVRPITGSPAQQAGIQSGDTIRAVDGVRVEESTPEQVINSLQGMQGTRVQVEIVRHDSPVQTISIVRQKVNSPSIDNIKIIDSTSKIGYMRINHFQKSTADELDVALHYLYDNKMQRLIIDLRGNPGGLLQAAIDASNRFLSQGIVVSTKGKNEAENNTYIVQKTQTWNVPLVLLIDNNSASAAEIFSGAMRDHRRATIVGTTSYGKGSVQGIFPLKANSMGLRMTTAKFYSPLGKGYTRVGVSPDIEVRKTALLNEDEDPLIVPAEEDDAVLQAGLNAAREME